MNSDLDNDLLRAFVTITRTGSFSRAAKLLHRTQAALSLQVKRLEDDLGVKLLERSPRAVAMTEAGETLLPYATKILSLGEDARRALQPSGQVETIRIGMLEDIAIGALSRVLERFTSHHPHVQLEIVIDDSQALSRMLRDARLDMVIADRQQVDALPAFSWNERLVWVAAHGFRMPSGQDAPVIAFGKGCFWQAPALAQLDASGISWRVVLSSANLGAICSAVEAGMGISFMLEYSVNRSALRILGAEDGLRQDGSVQIGVFLREGGGRSEQWMALYAAICAEVATGRGAELPVVA